MKRKSNKRSNGEGTIVFESDRNKYRAFLTDPNGKRISKRFSSNAEALQWLTETRADIYRDEYIPTSDITLGEWVIRYLEMYKKSSIRENTYELYLILATHFDSIANYTLQSVNSDILQKFFNTQLETLSLSTVKKLRSLLSQSFNKAIEFKIISESPVKSTTLPTEERKHIDTYDKEQITHFLNNIYNDTRYKKYASLFRLLFYTGMRIGEVLGLTIDNVRDGYIFITNTSRYNKKKFYNSSPKTKNSTRRVDIPQDLVKELIATHNNAPTNFVFHTKKNNPFIVVHIRRVWYRLLKKYNLPKLKIHGIRHTHATFLIGENIPIPDIARRLGHSKTSTLLDNYAEYISGYDSVISEHIAKTIPLHPNCSQNEK